MHAYALSDSSARLRRRFRKLHCVLRVGPNTALRNRLLRGEIAAQALVALSPDALDQLVAAGEGEGDQARYSLSRSDDAAGRLGVFPAAADEGVGGEEGEEDEEDEDEDEVGGEEGEAGMGEDEEGEAI